MWCSSNPMVIPTLLKFFQGLIDSRNVYVVEGKQMILIQCFQQVRLLKKIEQSIVQWRHTPTHINPYPSIHWLWVEAPVIMLLIPVPLCSNICDATVTFSPPKSDLLEKVNYSYQEQSMHCSRFVIIQTFKVNNHLGVAIYSSMCDNSPAN